MSSKDTLGYLGKCYANEIQLFNNVVHFRISKYLNAEKVLQCACIYLM